MISEERLSSFPVRRGIRQRGKAMTRLETFVDASFAFALTLLVISFDNIPENTDELVMALKGIPAFALCFAIIVMPWMAHREWSQNFGLEEGGSTIISFILVFVILVYVFPLRIMMGIAFENMTGGWALSQFSFDSIEEVRFLIIVYGLGFVAASLCIVMLNFQALRLARELQLNRIERFSTNAIIGGWSIIAGMGLISIVLAMTLPDDLIGYAGWFYFLMPIVMPLYVKYVQKKSRSQSS